MSEDSCRPSNNYKSMLRPAGRAELRKFARLCEISQQHLCTTMRRFFFHFQMFEDADPVPNHNTCFTNALEYVLLLLWMRLFYHWHFNLISISEYVNYQLLQEETECNMKMSYHVGINPSSALTPQLPSAYACGYDCCVVFINREQNPCKTKLNDTKYNDNLKFDYIYLLFLQSID